MAETLSFEAAFVTVGVLAFLVSFLWVIYWFQAQLRKYRYEPDYHCPICDIYYRLIRQYFAYNNKGKEAREVMFQRLIIHVEAAHPKV